MSEVKKDGVQDQSPTSDDTKETAFLDGTYRGQRVSWDEEEARTLAQKGLDYETKKAALAAEREELSSEKEDYQKWKAWRESLRADPSRAEAVARAWQDPNIVLRPQAHGDGDDGEQAPVQHQHQVPSVPPEVLQLKSQIEQLQGKLDNFTSTTEEKASADRLARAVDSFSFLSGNTDATEAAMGMAEGLMANDPEMTPEGAAAVAASKLKGLVRSQKQEKLDRKGKAEDMRTLDTSEGVPVGGSEKKKEKPKWGSRRTSTFRGDMLKEFTEGKFRDQFPNAFQ